MSSTFLGSTKTNFTSAGCFLYNKEVKTAFNPTDFPWPVAPAINKCGILARSTTNVSFEMVFPKAIGSSISEFWNLSEEITDFIETIVGFLLGTSIPIVPFPGIGAIIRIPKAESDKAISSSKFLIFEIRIPASGTISYKVTVGPTVAFMRSMPIL